MSDQEDSEMEVEFEEELEEPEQVGEQADDGSRLSEGKVEGTVQGAEAAEPVEDSLKMLKEFTDDWLGMVTEHNQLIEEKLQREVRRGAPEESKTIVQGILKTLTGTHALVEQFSSMIDLVERHESVRAELEGKSETEQQKKKRELNEKKIHDMIESYNFMTIDRDRKMTETMHETRQQEHLFFADRVFGYILKYFGIKSPREDLEEMEGIYKNSMGRAVLGISMLYRDKWREAFKTIKQRVIYYDNFPAFCCLVPVEKYGPYFYSVLQRIAIIFEMALFCFDTRRDFFELAINCIPHFFDADFFADAGDWERLEKAADIVCTLTLPLQKALGGEKSGCNSFSDVIKDLVALRVLGADSREHSLLQELNESFETRRKEAGDSAMDVSGAEESEKKVLVDYFRGCFPDDCPERFYKLAVGEDYVVDLESWIYEVSSQKRRKEVIEIRERLREQFLRTEREFADMEKQRQQKGKSVASEAQNVPTEEPGKDTGAVPKRRDRKRKPPKYCFIQTDHVEDLLELYRRALPSFLKTYLHNYFTPEIDDKTCLLSYEDACFMLPETLFKERRGKIKQKTCRQNRLWGECPQGFSCPLPVELERKLDSYIVNKLYKVIQTGMGGEILYFLGPKSVVRKASEQKPAWTIKSNLDEYLDPEIEGNKAMKKYKKLLRNTRDYRLSTAEEDHDQVRKLRLLSEIAVDTLGKGRRSKEQTTSEAGPSKKKRRPRKKRSKK